MQPSFQKPARFSRTPPAIFTPLFGLFGLGLAWRRAEDGFGLSEALGGIILGAVALFYLFAVFAYAAKVVRRPGVFGEDLKTLPGRTGLAAMVLGAYLLAATLVPHAQVVAMVVLLLGLVAHLAVLFGVLRILLSGPAEVRAVTPVWHLVFVGFIVSPLAALPLGWADFGNGVFWGSLVMALAIWLASLGQLARKAPPPPLRPTLAIHLAPASLLGTVAYLTARPELGFVLGIGAIVILALLLARALWIIEAGFSPFWGAFTFPLAAFANLMLLMGQAGEGLVFKVLGNVALVAATFLIPWIAYKVTQMWAKGSLATKTNAAQA